MPRRDFADILRPWFRITWGSLYCTEIRSVIRLKLYGALLLINHLLEGSEVIGIECINMPDV